MLTGSPEDASVSLRVGSSEGAEVRVRDGEQGSVLELVGVTADELDRVAAYVATEFPFLPDGTDLAKLEADLLAFLQGETPWGRVSQLAGLQQRLNSEVVKASLPQPPPAAPRLLGVPVNNSARDGELRKWTATFTWEGDRLLQALADYAWTPGDAVVVEGYLSESQAVREALQTRIETLLLSQDVAARTVLRSAYKPGLCWLLEEIGPQLKALGVVELRTECQVQRRECEPEDRWLRELYPVATLLEQTYDVSVTLGLAEMGDTYRVVGLNREGHVVFEDRLSPPTLETPLNGAAEGGFVYPTSGHLSVSRGSQVLFEQALPTDRDLFWEWYSRVVLPEVTRGVAPDAAGPYFSELSVVVALSEPDVSLGLDHEQLSATESLHEDIYFGTLEVLHDAAGLSVKDRSLTPGRILPFCTVAEAQATTATVVLRSVGSSKVGLTDVAGSFHEVPTSACTILSRSLKLLPDGTPHVTLILKLQAEAAAHTCLAQLGWGVTHREELGGWNPFPYGSRLSVQVEAAGRIVWTVKIPEQPIPVGAAQLPERPLLTREVTAYAQQLARKSLQVYMRPVRESQGGAPLLALELTSPANASRARLAAWKPSVMISARQHHANEPTSTNAMFGFLEEELARNDLLKHVNIVFHPLENPDGARLHAALCQLSARHMHHAARYTAVGADLQTNPRIGNQVIPKVPYATRPVAAGNPGFTSTVTDILPMNGSGQMGVTSQEVLRRGVCRSAISPSSVRRHPTQRF